MPVGRILPIPNLNFQFAHAGAQVQFLSMPMPQAALAVGGKSRPAFGRVVAVSLASVLSSILGLRLRPRPRFQQGTGRVPLDFSWRSFAVAFVVHLVGGIRSPTIIGVLSRCAPCLLAFDSLLDKVMERKPNVSRDILRKSIIKAHRQWALKQDNKPPAIPPKA
jgi:hypothetical protein